VQAAGRPLTRAQLLQRLWPDTVVEEGSLTSHISVLRLCESGHRDVSPYNIARVYGAIDDKLQALHWLERACQEHNPDLIELTREPSFRSL
jgi:hypothetical protein